jgi:hypothetical protein
MSALNFEVKLNRSFSLIYSTSEATLTAILNELSKLSRANMINWGGTSIPIGLQRPLTRKSLSPLDSQQN